MVLDLDMEMSYCMQAEHLLQLRLLVEVRCPDGGGSSAVGAVKQELDVH